MSTPQSFRNRLVPIFLVAAFLAAPSFAQVTIERSENGLIIRNEGFKTQRVVRQQSLSGFSVASTSGTWVVLDDAGNSYTPGTFEAGTGRDDPDPGDIIVVGGYEGDTGRDDPDPGDIIVVGGYEEVLDHLRTGYGAVIERDPVLGVDLIALPNETDPIARFFEIIVADSLHGYPLIDYFRLTEVVAKGSFDQPAPVSVEPQGTPFPFPNDTYLRNQWNLVWSRTLQAQWHPYGAKTRVRVGIIDSGVGTEARTHTGLDGTEIAFVPVAPTTGRPVDHGLSLVTLLGDRANDASGLVGLLGDQWNLSGCSGTPFFQSAPPVLRVYNVGDFGPISVYVARAIRQAVADGVDVINLSLALPNSALVEGAIREALAANVIVVAAAGNYSPDAVEKPAKFPANLQGVIAVGAADRNMRPVDFSARLGVTVYAPGVEIVAGADGNTWVSQAGTSYAAPHVTAAVAILRAAVPGISRDQVVHALDERAQHGSADAPFLNTLSALNHVLPPSVRQRVVQLPTGCKATSEVTTQNFVYNEAPDEGLFEPVLLTGGQIPQETSLSAPYPNPFSTSATIRFALAASGRTKISVFDSVGRLVRVLVDQELQAGTHDLQFSGSYLPAGMYIIQLNTGYRIVSQTVSLVR